MSRHVLLICGPPCAGKSTLARTLAQPGDLVLDRDQIAIDIGLGAYRRRSKQANRDAERIFQNKLKTVADSADITAYVVRSLPYATQRRQLAAYLDAQVRLLDPGIEECLRRARADNRPPITVHWIHQWYRQYQPDRPHKPRPAISSIAVDLDDL